VADTNKRLTDGQKVQLARRLVDLLEQDRPEVQRVAWRALCNIAPRGAPITDRPRDEASLREAARSWRTHWEQFELENLVEPRAGSYLNMARRLEAVGKKKTAAIRYRRVIEDFPTSSAAAEARRRLHAMGTD
jgi:hypothetical protein